MAELHNSLYYLDRAKWQWAEKHKPEQDVPTMEDLTLTLEIGEIAADANAILKSRQQLRIFQM